eukprot:TRINITY_DN55824_c0_g1_i1.p1 TRINITY_DN55824_c0_g1~~TRINITY_DN55824_c0_g1_i1.p1  ORF type:complete len:250 (+),score=36.72 TRINITY_DN55824_c0_g1_i1:112-750(+)
MAVIGAAGQPVQYIAAYAGPLVAPVAPAVPYVAHPVPGQPVFATPAPLPTPPMVAHYAAAPAHAQVHHLAYTPAAAGRSGAAPSHAAPRPSTSASSTAPLEVLPGRAPGAKVYVGTIKKIITEGGFGFLRCGATFRKYGKDVFVPAHETRGLAIGDRVAFEIALSHHGRPQARNVVLRPRIAQDPARDEDDEDNMPELQDMGPLEAVGVVSR